MASSIDEAPRGAGPLPVERFWNLPNTISLLRCGVVPFLMALPWFPGRFPSQVVAWLFIVAALSDLVDGFGLRHAYSVRIEESHPAVQLTFAADRFLRLGYVVPAATIGHAGYRAKRG